MPWILIPGALRGIRKARKLDRKEAAKLIKLDERTLHRHETDELAPRTLQVESVNRYCKGYDVKPEAFVRWSDHEEDATARKERSDRVRDPAAPRVATLTQRAKHELLIKAQKRILVGDESLEVVGNVIMRECMITFAPYQGRRFVVEGAVEDADYVPEPAMRALGGKLGEGGRYRISRQVVKGLPVYVTVFAPQAAHALYLNECHRSDRRVSLAVRVFVKPPDEYWKGFFIFEKKPIPRHWCFVVESILPASDVAALARAPRNRAISADKPAAQ